MSEIKPALTAGEWAYYRDNPPAAMSLIGSIESLPPELKFWHVAVANHALPDDDPRKLVALDVIRLREAAGGLEDVGAPHLGAAIDRLADKLAALLPPETP